MNNMRELHDMCMWNITSLYYDRWIDSRDVNHSNINDNDNFGRGRNNHDRHI